MLRKSAVILAAALAVLSTLDSVLGIEGAAHPPVHQEVERPRFYKKQVKRFVFANSNASVAGAGVNGANVETSPAFDLTSAASKVRPSSFDFTGPFWTSSLPTRPTSIDLTEDEATSEGQPTTSQQAATTAPPSTSSSHRKPPFVNFAAEFGGAEESQSGTTESPQNTENTSAAAAATTSAPQQASTSSSPPEQNNAATTEGTSLSSSKPGPFGEFAAVGAERTSDTGSGITGPTASASEKVTTEASTGEQNNGSSESFSNPAGATATGVPTQTISEDNQGNENGSSEPLVIPTTSVQGEQILEAIKTSSTAKGGQEQSNGAAPSTSTGLSSEENQSPDVAATSASVSAPNQGVLVLPGGATVSLPDVGGIITSVQNEVASATADLTGVGGAASSILDSQEGGIHNEVLLSAATSNLGVSQQGGQAAVTSKVGEQGTQPSNQIPAVPGQSAKATNSIPENSNHGSGSQEGGGSVVTSQLPVNPGGVGATVSNIAGGIGGVVTAIAGAATSAVGGVVNPGAGAATSAAGGVVNPGAGAATSAVGGVVNPGAGAATSGVAGVVNQGAGAVSSIAGNGPGSNEGSVNEGSSQGNTEGNSEGAIVTGGGAVATPGPALPSNPEQVLGPVPTGAALYTALTNALGSSVPSGYVMLPNGVVVPYSQYENIVNPTRAPYHPAATLQSPAGHRTQANYGHFTLPGGAVLANPYVTSRPANVQGHFTVGNGINAEESKDLSAGYGHFTVGSGINAGKEVSANPEIPVSAAISNGAVLPNPTNAEKLNPSVPVSEALNQGAVVPNTVLPNPTQAGGTLASQVGGNLVEQTGNALTAPVANAQVPITEPNGQVVSGTPGAIIPFTGADGKVTPATVPQATGLAGVVGSQTLPNGQVAPVSAGQETGVATLPNGSIVPLKASGAPGATEGSEATGAAAGKTLPNGSVIPASNPAAATGLATLPNGSVVPVASAASAASASENGQQQTGAPQPTSLINPAQQQYPTNDRGPFTQQPTGYDSATAQEVPTSIIAGPSTMPSSESAGSGPTGLPSNVPLVLYPPTGPVKPPDNCDLIQLGFRYPLNYDFVETHPESQMQIFKYLPMGISYALAIELDNVTMQTLRAWDTTQDLHYITTLALAWIPTGLIDSLGLLVQTPTSRFYHNPDQSTKTLLDMINNALPIHADNSTDGGDIPYGTIPSSTNNPEQNGAPIGGGIGASQPVRASAVGIGVGVAFGAAAYGAAMFFVARRYRRRRQSHMRSPSMFSSPVMSQHGGEPGATTALMSGGMVERSMSPYHDDDGRAGAGSRGSGRSGSSRHQISAPVMAENSLGWN